MQVEQLIGLVQPTAATDATRAAVFAYMSRLIRSSGAVSFWFGSVPLKTYLPDGDIDMCAIPASGTVDQFFAHLKSALEREAKAVDGAEFPVHSVTYIPDVRLLKAKVGNILVDVSVNRAGGIGALCFLEEVDRLIGRSHLFKRSILLVKAWWYTHIQSPGAYFSSSASFVFDGYVSFTLPLTSPCCLVLTHLMQ